MLKALDQPAGDSLAVALVKEVGAEVLIHATSLRRWYAIYEYGNLGAVLEHTRDGIHYPLCAFSPSGDPAQEDCPSWKHAYRHLLSRPEANVRPWNDYTPLVVNLLNTPNQMSHKPAPLPNSWHALRGLPHLFRQSEP